jgi:hypothetical protein
MITVHKTKLIEIGGRVELLVGFNENIEYFPLAKEEMHGIHLINEDNISYVLTSCEIVIGGTGIDLLPQMDFKMVELIKDLLID